MAQLSGRLPGELVRAQGVHCSEAAVGGGGLGVASGRPNRREQQAQRSPAGCGTSETHGRGHRSRQLWPGHKRQKVGPFCSVLTGLRPA